MRQTIKRMTVMVIIMAHIAAFFSFSVFATSDTEYIEITGVSVDVIQNTGLALLGIMAAANFLPPFSTPADDVALRLFTERFLGGRTDSQVVLGDVMMDTNRLVYSDGNYYIRWKLDEIQIIWEDINGFFEDSGIGSEYVSDMYLNGNIPMINFVSISSLVEQPGNFFTSIRTNQFRYEHIRAMASAINSISVGGGELRGNIYTLRVVYNFGRYRLDLFQNETRARLVQATYPQAGIMPTGLVLVDHGARVSLSVFNLHYRINAGFSEVMLNEHPLINDISADHLGVIRIPVGIATWDELLIIIEQVTGASEGEDEILVYFPRETSNVNNMEREELIREVAPSPNNGNDNGGDNGNNGNNGNNGDGILGWLYNIGNWLMGLPALVVNWIGSMVVPIGNWIKDLFVPSEDFFQGQFNQLDERLQVRLPFQTYIDTIGRLRGVSSALDNTAYMFDIEFTLQGQQIQLEVGAGLLPHLRRVRPVVTGLYLIFLAYYNYRQIMFLIRGTNYHGVKETLSRAGE